MHWALLSSDAVRQIIDDGYKVSPHLRVDREELDTNSGLGVLPLHKIKGDNYYLVEGRDTRFRIYHETNPHHKIVNISSVAHDKPSLVEFAEKLSTGSKLEQELAGAIRDTIIARIEAAEQRRVKAEQAALRLATWQAAPPVYNTRTRGKRVDYSEFGKDSDSDEEEGGGRGRRSERNRGEREIVEYTASGRMVKRPRLNGVDSRESRKKEEPEPEESDEEMDWSVYSDKGETEGDDDDGEDGEDEEYDIGGRSLVVCFKITKEGLKSATSGELSGPVNGKTDSPMTTYNASPSYPLLPSVSVAKPYQQGPNHAMNVPYRSPMQTAGPVPYAAGASPPISSRPIQLSPRPIPRPLAHNRVSQGLSRPQPYPHPQISPQPYRPSQTGSFRPAPYSMTQYQPVTVSSVQSMLAGPHTQPPINGLGPSVIDAELGSQHGTGWLPPRPFGTASIGQEIRVYDTSSAPTSADITAPSYQNPLPPNKQPIYPLQQTWPAADFKPATFVNISPHERTDAVAGLSNKIPPQSGSVASTGLNASRDEGNIGAINGEEIMNDSVKDGNI